MQDNIAGQHYLTGLVCGVAGGLVQGLLVVYSSASDVKCFLLPDCYPRAFLYSPCLRTLQFLPCTMPTTCNTNNSLQTAPVLPLVPNDADSRPNVEVGDSQAPEASNSDAGISPAMASFITRTVQAALAAERANNQVSSLTSSSVVSSLANPPILSPVPVATVCSGGIAQSGTSSLYSSANSVLAVGGGLSHQRRPIHSIPVIVPSFVLIFTLPSMSLSVSSAINVYNLQKGAICDFADRSAMLASPLLDQAFIVGPSFSPVAAKIVAQIVAGKYIDLSELLAVNLVQKDPEPQLLLDGWLVLTSQPKKQRRHIEDIALWMEAFTIFPSYWLTIFLTAGRISCSTSF